MISQHPQAYAKLKEKCRVGTYKNDPAEQNLHTIMVRCPRSPAGIIIPSSRTPYEFLPEREETSLTC